MTRVTLCRNTLDVRGCDMRQGERALTLTLLGLERVAADSHRSAEPAPLRDGNNH